MWCVPEVTPLFIERMEDVLELYAKPYNPKEPVLCFDEKSKQLIKDTRAGRNTGEGEPRRNDYEYKRNGVRNVFLAVEPKGGYRSVRVTARRTKEDFAKEIRRIIALRRYRNAKKIHIVLDNLNIHFEGSLLLAFGKTEARNILRRITFHHTPVHASWLNMAEIEIGVMTGQCIKGRIATEGNLKEKLRHWQTRRNRAKATISWGFTVRKAREKFHYKPKELC